MIIETLWQRLELGFYYLGQLVLIAGCLVVEVRHVVPPNAADWG
jgi:hypothetical protein